MLLGVSKPSGTISITENNQRSIRWEECAYNTYKVLHVAHMDDSRFAMLRTLFENSVPVCAFKALRNAFGTSSRSSSSKQNLSRLGVPRGGEDVNVKKLTEEY